MIHAFIKKGCFQDSVSLMIISRKLGTLRRRTVDSFGVKFQEAIPADAEPWPIAAADLGFLLGSGTYTFHYAV